MRVAIVGSVSSTQATLKKLIEHQINVVKVYGYEPDDMVIVSGYRNLKEISEENKISYQPFRRINDHADAILKDNLDVLFVVGLSQLVSETIISAPTYGCVGFHPTLLPEGRGRAPIAWLVMNATQGAASFFLINDEADAGPIFIQEVFDVEDTDNAKSIETKILSAIDKALDNWLPKLKRGLWRPIPQDEMVASEYGVRKPEDGWINWHCGAADILKLIRASAPPHPGAFTFLGGSKLVITEARLEKEMKIQGVIGRVLKVQNEACLVQTGDGLLWVTEYSKVEKFPRVGQKLGYDVEIEINNMKQELKSLAEALERYE